MQPAATQPAAPPPPAPLFLQLAVAGAANCCGALITHPLDVVKVRMQLGATGGAAHALAAIATREGLPGLYAGLAPSLLRESTYSALRLGLYGPFRDVLSQGVSGAGRDAAAPPPLWVRLLAGVASGVVGCAVASPTDLIKVRAQTAPPSSSAVRSGAPSVSAGSRGIIATASAIIQQEGGVLALWAGGIPNVTRAALLTAAQVGSYDAIKSSVRQAAAEAVSGGGPAAGSFSAAALAEEGPFLHFVSAFFAGGIACVVSTPVDTAKSRLMAQRRDVAESALGGGLGAGRYRGMVDCLVRIAAAEGIRGWYAGFGPAWARLTLHTVVTMTAFEQLRRLVGIPAL